MNTTLAHLPAYEDMRNARREVLAVQDPAAQAALFTLLGLISMLEQALRESVRP